jgi:hypothetical protein
MVPMIKMQRLDYIVSLFGASILVTFWLVVATFPKFFFFNPLGVDNELRRFELVLSTAGWISISTIVPFLFFLIAIGKSKARTFIPYAALLYPVSLIISQITVYVQTGSAYLSYLKNFPIFIYTDIFLPILILFIWHDIRELTLAQSAKNE